MARIRTIKPDFFLHEELADVDAETGLPIRLAFIGLWCCADREGRFEWRPRRLKPQILPYDDTDFSRVLHALCTRGFIEKYVVDGTEYGFIPGFTEHQVINNRERESDIPKPNENNTLTRDGRVNDASTTPLFPAQAEGKGREGKEDSSEPKDSEPSGNGTMFISLPLNDKTEHPITESEISEWEKLYPAVDVRQELREMRGWCMSNPAKRKTKRGITRFVTSWLSREQDRGGSKKTQPSSGADQVVF